MIVIVVPPELQDLARDLAAAGVEIEPKLRPVVSRGGLQIKRQLQAEMSASTHFRSIAGSITYLTTATRNAVEAEVGPDKTRGGALANVAYFGTSRGGGTVPDPVGALRAEAPRFAQAIDDVLQGMRL